MSRQREAAPIGETRKRNADQGDPVEIACEFAKRLRQQIHRQVQPEVPPRRIGQTFGRIEARRPVLGPKPGIGDDHVHADAPSRTGLPPSKWMPHSTLPCPGQRPARASSPNRVGTVQGSQPTEVKPFACIGCNGRPFSVT